MRISEQIDLISVTHENDAKGVSRAIETSRTVFCRVESISSDEYFRAGSAGLRPAYRFRLHADEYRWEPTVRYQGVKYAVYRTYRASLDELEIYVEGKKGV